MSKIRTKILIKKNQKINNSSDTSVYIQMQSLGKKLSALKCPLADERRANKVLPVLGEGSLTAQIMFVGEAPGKKEAQTGKPFCGASGKFLSEMVASIGIKREDVYITNIVKDRPTDNRDPSVDEIKQYGSFLNTQIEIIKPKVIVTLGRFSMQYIMKLFELDSELQPISNLHGKVFKVVRKAKLGTKTLHTPSGSRDGSSGTVYIIPLYHPAVALYNGGMRGVLFEDFKAIKGVI